MRFNLKIYKRSRRQIFRADVSVTSKFERTFTRMHMDLAWQHMFFYIGLVTEFLFSIFLACLWASSRSRSQDMRQRWIGKHNALQSETSGILLGDRDLPRDPPIHHPRNDHCYVLRAIWNHHHAWFCLLMQSLVNLYSSVHSTTWPSRVDPCQRFWREPPIESANEIVLWAGVRGSTFVDTMDMAGLLISRRQGKTDIQLEFVFQGVV